MHPLQGKEGKEAIDFPPDEAAQRAAEALAARRAQWGPPRPRVSAGSLVGRRVVVAGSSSEALNGRRGVAISFVESGCHYTVELDPEVPTPKKKKKKKKKKDAFGYEVADDHSGSEGEEEDDEKVQHDAQDELEATEPEPSASAPAGKRKFVRLIGACLVDELEPGNEEPEEDPAVKVIDEVTPCLFFYLCACYLGICMSSSDLILTHVACLTYRV